MTRAEKLERQIAEIRSGKSDGVEELREKKAEIKKVEARMNGSKNGFVRQCCAQELERLEREYKALDAEV